MVVILLFHKHSLLRLLPGRGGVLEVSCRAVRLNETATFMIFARSGARR